MQIPSGCEVIFKNGTVSTSTRLDITRQGEIFKYGKEEIGNGPNITVEFEKFPKSAINVLPFTSTQTIFFWIVGVCFAILCSVVCVCYYHGDFRIRNIQRGVMANFERLREDMRHLEHIIGGD